MSISAPSPFAAVVIGGGISGLSCAYRLQRAGIPARVLEAGGRPGGMIATKDKGGFRFELGPQSFLTSEPLLKLIESVGLNEQLVPTDRRAPRYILSRGKLTPAPLAPPSLLTSGLLGAATKWRIFTEIFHHTRPPEDDESIAAFVRRKFGEELLDQLVAPFVSGVYAGDPEKLSLRSAFPKLHEFETVYGSVLKGAMKSRPPKGTRRAGLCSFRDGMETLPRGLATRLGDLVFTESRRCRGRNPPRLIRTIPRGVFAHRVRPGSGRLRRLPARADSAARERIRVFSAARRKIACPGHGVEFLAFPKQRSRPHGHVHKLCGRRNRSRFVRVA